MGSDAVNLLEKNTRQAGVLAHPTSFPSPYGIGDLGDSAYTFIDFLVGAGQSLWQVLPIGPTGYGDSPYQAFSSFAGQPLIISPTKLYDMGLLSLEDLNDIKPWDPKAIDYGPVINYKLDLLRKSFKLFDATEDATIKKAYKSFCTKEKTWLNNYALFMATKDFHDGVVWTEWDKEIAFPTEASRKKWTKKLAKEINFYKFIQFIFYKQWFELKAYANNQGISIIGDTPIFVAFDSADVWADKELFYLDKKGYPTIVAGVPPDYFSETGQLWGNPLYNWEVHAADGFKWWINKVEGTLKVVDTLRIDHFRGFEAYWAVEYGAPNAIEGEWCQAPGMALFEAIQADLGPDIPIIAEDLGVITPAVEALRDTFDLPGMKILQFGFEAVDENNFLPHHFVPNSVCYTGTHDNDTTLSWFDGITDEAKDKIRRYLNTNGDNIVWDMIRAAWGSVSRMAIVPLQDVMYLGAEGRMNTPGVAAGNWQWRYTEEMLNKDIQQHLFNVTKLYGRLQDQSPE